MKKIILIVALFGTASLFAQTQNENPLINDITAILKNIDKQNKAIDAPTKPMNKMGFLPNLSRKIIARIVESELTIPTPIVANNCALSEAKPASLKIVGA